MRTLVPKPWCLCLSRCGFVWRKYQLICSDREESSTWQWLVEQKRGMSCGERKIGGQILQKGTKRFFFWRGREGRRRKRGREKVVLLRLLGYIVKHEKLFDELYHLLSVFKILCDFHWILDLCGHRLLYELINFGLLL